MYDKQAEREKNRQRRRLMKQKIQEVYQQLLDAGREDEALWAELVTLLDDYAKPAVLAQLSKTPFNKSEDLEDVFGIAHEALSMDKVFTNYAAMKTSDPEAMFADYCRAIYKFKALDYIEERSKIPTVSDPDDYLDIAVESNPDRIPGSDEHLGELTGIEWVIKYYVDEVTACDEDRFQIMKLCYSRILPVILDMTGCESSDKWAWKQMDGKNMQLLSRLFEDTFNATMDHVRASWSDIHWQMLEAPFITRDGRSIPVREVILTEEFTKENTKNWVPRLHDRIMTRIISKFSDLNDEVMAQMVTNYMMRKKNKK